MNLKKLKRLLSLTLSAAMVASMISVPVNAETVTDSPASALEETVDGLMDENAAIGGEDEADKVEDPEVVDETEEEEGVAEAFAEELHSANETDDAEPMPLADDDTAGGNGGDSSDAGNEGGNTPGEPDATAAIVVGDDTTAGQYATLDAAIEATKVEGAAKTITLDKDAELTGEDPYELKGVTINTKGHMITIPAGADIILNNATIINDAKAEVEDNPKWSNAEKNHLMLNAVGTLKINGGTYKTAAVQLLKVTGIVEIRKSDEGNVPTFTCIPGAGQTDGNWYDGSTLIDVDGVGAKLTMENGEVHAKIGNYDTQKDSGMYGIYVWHGGELVLGTVGQKKEEAPVIESMFSAIGMNGTTAPGKITVNSGQYTTYADCSGDIENYSAVMYLPSNANVNINGGTFEEIGENGHVISIPYSKVGNKPTNPLIRLNLNIKGGKFISKQDVFYTGAEVPDNEKIKVAITGGTFSKEPVKKYVADGYGAYVRTVEGTAYYVVTPTAIAMVDGQGYNTLEEALKVAKESNKDITLEGDVELTEGEYDFSGVTILTEGHMITIPEGATVKLKGGEDGIIRNTETADGNDWRNLSQNKTILCAKGTLNIEGGKFETAGVKALYVAGKATINENAAFECTYTAAAENTYDGASLIEVDGAGAELTMLNGKVTADVGMNEDGMYGIYVRSGGKLKLGETGSVGPTITSRFAAIGMNATTAPGKITVNSGEYKSTVVCGTGNEFYNAVIYLPATADVTINGGTFTASGDHAVSSPGEKHVISVPHKTVSVSGVDKSIKLNLIINDGTFNVNKGSGEGAVFYDSGMGKDSLNKISVRGGMYDLQPEYYVDRCYSATLEEESNYYKVTENGAHALKWIKKKEPDCWEEGVIGHYECANCGKMYKTKNIASENELLPENVVIPKEDHASDITENIEVVPKTCTTDGKKVYVKCEKCGLYYASMAALQEDTDGTLGKSEDDFIEKATGHVFGQPDVDWEGFSYSDFVKGEPQTVKVIRSCSVADCDYSQEAEGSVKLADDGALIANCELGGTVELKVTASFKKDNFDKEITDETKFEKVETVETYTVDPIKHEFDKASFNWDEFNGSEFVAGKDNGVTAEATCSVCGKEVGASEVKVTCDDYPNGALKCSESRMFKATATFNTQGESVPKEDTKECCGEHILEQEERYVPATCTTKGCWGYYRCTGCEKFCLGEDSAKSGNWLGEGTTDKAAIPEREIKIDVRPHDLKWKGVVWSNEEDNIAKARFLCSSCGKTLEIDGIKATKDGSQTDTGACGQDITESYTASIDLDKSAVEVVDGKLTYNKEDVNSENTIRYSGKLTKQVPKPHELQATAKWIDLGENPTATGVEGKIYDTSKGVKVTISCENCDKEMTVTSAGDIVDDEELDIFASVSLVLDTAKGTPATCVKEGKAFYNVIVTYDDGTTMGKIPVEQLSTLTEIEEDAHTWGKVSWSGWEQIKDNNGLKTAKVTIEGVEYEVPVYEIKATRKCVNAGCTTGEETHTATVGKEVTAEEAKGFHVEIGIKHRKKTCLRSGRTTYTASAYVGSEKIAEDQDGTYSTSAIYDDPVEGHKVVLKWSWEPEEEGDEIVGYKAVSVTRECTVCSKDESVPANEKLESVTYTAEEEKFTELEEDGELEFPTENGITVGHKGSKADCDNAGESSYEVYVRFDGITYREEKTIVSDALGHEDRWYIVWNQDTDAEEEKDEWTARAEKRCSRANCSRPKDEVVQGNANVTVDYTPGVASCIEAGESIWEASFVPTDSVEIADNQEFEQKEEVPMNSLHKYNAGTVEWSMTYDGNGKMEVTVTFERTCSLAPNDDSHTDRVIMKKVEPTEESESITDCKQDATLKYKVAAPKDWTMESGWESQKEYKWEAGSHKPKAVEAVGGEDCNKPGNPRYYTCTRCGKNFKTSSCTTEFTPSTERLGHLYGTPVYKWADGEEGKEAIAIFTCTRSGCTEGDEGHTKEVPAALGTNPYYEPENAPKCEKVSPNIGHGYHVVTVNLEEDLDNIKAGIGLYEDELEGDIMPVPHHYIDSACEWCKTLEPGIVKATFYGRTGNEIQSIVYHKNDKDQWKDPFVPPQAGYEFKGWKIDNIGNALDSTQLKAAIEEKLPAKEEDEGVGVRVYASYESLDKTGSVKVTKYYGNTADDANSEVHEKLAVGEMHNVIAEESVTKDGKTYQFVGWMIGNSLVSTNLSYDVYIQDEQEIEIKAMYSEEEKREEKPLVTITGVQGLEASGSYSLSFTSSMSIPEGYTVVEKGFLYSLKASITDSDMVYNFVNTSVKKLELDGEKTNILTIAIPSSKLGSKVAAKAYVKYTNAEGVEKIVYSSFVQTTYNEATGTTE